MKEYLFHARAEKDYAGDPITVVYVSPKVFFETKRIIPDFYDEEDEKMIEKFLSKNGIEESSEWIFETYNLSKEEASQILRSESFFTETLAFTEFVTMGNE